MLPPIEVVITVSVTLAAQLHRERWQDQNLDRHSQLLTDELTRYFHCDVDKSLAVSNWAYQVASSNGAKLWLAKDRFELAGSKNVHALDLVAQTNHLYNS